MATPGDGPARSTAGCPVDVALDSVWPAELRTDRLHLRPVAADDASLVGELLTDSRVRAYLGGPLSHERVAARQAAYPQAAGVWALVRVADDQAVGLASIGPGQRCPGRAEVSYQLLPSAWGNGLDREAVSAVVAWWSAAAPSGGPVVAVTQAANTRSRRLLESVGMVLLDEIEEHGARQCLYTPGGAEDDSEVRWVCLVASRLDEVERRRGAQARHRRRPASARGSCGSHLRGTGAALSCPPRRVRTYLRPRGGPMSLICTLGVPPTESGSPG